MTEEAFGLNISEILEENTSAKDTLSSIAQLREWAYRSGFRGTAINQALFDYGASLAVAEGRPDLIELLSFAPTGPNGSTQLRDIPAFKQALTMASRLAKAQRVRLREGLVFGSFGQATSGAAERSRRGLPNPLP